MFTVTSYIGLFQRVSTQQVVKCSRYAVQIVYIACNIISQCHYHCVVDNHGVGTPFVTVGQFNVLHGICFRIPQSCGIGMTYVRNAVLRIVFLFNEEVCGIYDAVRDLVHFCLRQLTILQHGICIQVQGHGTQRRQGSPCEGTARTVVFTADQVGLYNVSILIRIQVGLIISLTSCDVQFASCPVEFVRYFGVAVRATTLVLIQRSIHAVIRICFISIRIIIGLCCCISLFSCSQQFRCIRSIIFFKQTRSLCQSSCKVQRSCKCYRLYNTSQISCFTPRCNCQCSPLVVVNLVVNHAVCSLHLQEEVSFNLYFVQDIRCAVSSFRNNNSARVVIPLRSVAVCYRTLINVHQSPQGNTAVNNVFTVVTSIVPTTCYINGVRVLASRVFCIDVNPFVSNMCLIRVVTIFGMTQSGGVSRSCILIFVCLYHQIFVNGNACTVLIEIAHCIGQQAIIDVIANVECQGLLAIAFNVIALARCSEIREVQDLRIIPSAFIVNSLTGRSASVNSSAGRILYREFMCAVVTICANQGSFLGQVRVITNLVQFDTRWCIILCCNIVRFVIGHIDQGHVVELQDCAFWEALKALIKLRSGTTEVEGPFANALMIHGIDYAGNVFHLGEINLEFISVSCPLICFQVVVHPVIPSLIVLDFRTSGRSTLQCAFYFCLCRSFCQTSYIQRSTVHVPVFCIIIGDVTQLGVEPTSLAGPHTIRNTISMTIFQAQTSVTELTVPTAFTRVAHTTRICNLDVVHVVFDFKAHGTGSRFANMPRQTSAVVEID